jgi:hypothetical protein
MDLLILLKRGTCIAIIQVPFYIVIKNITLFSEWLYYVYFVQYGILIKKFFNELKGERVWE